MKTIIFVAFLSIAFSASADDSPFRFGAHVGGGSYKASEQDGPSDRASGMAFGIVGTYDFGPGSRVLANVSRSGYKTEASDVQVGQKASETEVSLSYQTRWRILRSVKPWVGVGMGYVKSGYKQRYRLASPGSNFAVPLEDRNDKGALALVNLNWELDSDSSWSPGLQIQGGKSFSGKHNYVRAGVYFLY